MIQAIRRQCKATEQGEFELNDEGSVLVTQKKRPEASGRECDCEGSLASSSTTFKRKRSGHTSVGLSKLKRQESRYSLDQP